MPHPRPRCGGRVAHKEGSGGIISWHSFLHKEHRMKLVVAVIRSEKLAAVQQALAEYNLDQITVSNVFGSGRERGHSYIYRSQTIEERLVPRLKLEVAVDDTFVTSTVNAIRRNAQTGCVGD